MIVRIAAIGGLAAGGLVAFALILLVTLDLAVFARPLERTLGKALGREVIISGRTRVSLLPHLELRLGGVFIANRAGGSKPDLLLAQNVTARLRLAGPLHPRLVVDELLVEDVSLNLEPTPTGASWLFEPRATKAANELRVPGLLIPIVIAPRLIEVHDLQLAPRFPWLATADEFPIESVAIDCEPTSTTIVMRGAVGRDPWLLKAGLSSLEALVSGASFDIALQFSGLGAKAQLTGVAGFRADSKTDLSGSGIAEDTGRLFEAARRGAGKASPATFAFSMKNNGQVHVIKSVFGHLGTGNLKLDLRIDHGLRPSLTGSVDADVLDLRALPFRARPIRGERVLSKEPLAVDFLKGLQIDLGAKASTLSWGEVPIGRLDLGLWANNGILAAGPVRLSGPLIDLVGDGTLDVRATPKISLTVKMRVSELGVLLEAMGEKGVSGTSLSFAAEILGTGMSLAEIMSTSFGQTDLLIGAGRLSSATAAGLPAALIYGVDTVPEAPDGLDIRCLMSRFDISDGRGVSRALKIDTEHAITTGQGAIDFADEAIGFHLAPRPKDPALIGAARDILVSGSLLKPVYVPIDGEAQRGISRLSGQAALTEGFEALMPLLDSDAALGNPCMRSLLGQDELAGIGRPAEARLIGGGRSSEQSAAEGGTLP